MKYQWMVVSGRRWSYKDGYPVAGVPFAEFNGVLDGLVREGWEVQGDLHVEADHDRVTLLLRRELPPPDPYRSTLS